MQPTSPAALVARFLTKSLGKRLTDYAYVDFCAGAGGPTPAIERHINAGAGNVDFVMTDLHPHLTAWRMACQERPHLHYVPNQVNAADAPADLLQLAGLPTYGNTLAPDVNKPIFRLFSLAFHHLDDELAVQVLRNTLQTSAGFAIFELQGRHIGDIFTVLMMGPMLFLGSWYWFWGQWSHLFWTYVIPVLPFVVVFDGIVSCLRTREPDEIKASMGKALQGLDLDQLGQWGFESGGTMHTWPGGHFRYFIGTRR